MATKKEDESVESRQERARDSNTSPEAFEELAADEDEGVRSAAAGNPNMPAAALEKLAADEGSTTDTQKQWFG